MAKVELESEKIFYFSVSSAVTNLCLCGTKECRLSPPDPDSLSLQLSRRLWITRKKCLKKCSGNKKSEKFPVWLKTNRVSMACKRNPNIYSFTTHPMENVTGNDCNTGY